MGENACVEWGDEWEEVEEGGGGLEGCLLGREGVGQLERDDCHIGEVIILCTISCHILN